MEFCFLLFAHRPPNQLQKKNETVSPKQLSILAQYGAYEAARTEDKKKKMAKWLEESIIKKKSYGHKFTVKVAVTQCSACQLASQHDKMCCE